MAGDLLAAGMSPELEEVGGSPVACLQLGMLLACLACGRDHGGGGGEPLLEAVGAPQGDVSGVQR